MPKLPLDSSRKKRAVVHSVLNQLFQLREQAAVFNEKMKQCKEQMHNAPTREVFFNVIREMDSTAREVNALFRPVMMGLSSEIISDVSEAAKADPTLSMVWSVAFFDKSLSHSIINTKERLAEEALYKKLAKNKEEMASHFIDSIKALKSVADEINAQKEEFKISLAGSKSAEDVDIIEMQIEERDKVITSIYQQQVLFPDDKEVAGVLIQFLEENPHLQELMNTFNFHESLVDDILSARAHLASTYPYL